VAGRDQPWPWLARQLFRGPTLAEAWDRAAAGIVKLDLKQTDHAFLDELAAFVAPRASSRRVMISGGDQDALLYLRPGRSARITPTRSSRPRPVLQPGVAALSCGGCR
jgi:hypothetical protein